MSENWELEQEPDDLIERLRYWGKSKSRVRRGYHTGRMQDVMNRAADALEDQRREVCVSCGRNTVEISFYLGYGSRYDGAAVCWSCAEIVDDALEEQGAQEFDSDYQMGELGEGT